MNDSSEFDWRSIGALNTVSALAQVGQFGIAFVVVPVWLAERGLDASQLGLFAASLWMGQLPGLGVAPWLCARFGPKLVVAAGLACSILALALIAVTGWPCWPLGGTLAGFGLGLRWIGVEPWLYRIAPAHARGRLVGFHESLIALAPIVGPVLAGYVGLQGRGVFWIGTGFTALALVPLAIARTPGDAEALVAAASSGGMRRGAWGERVFRQGLAVALLGGMMDAAVCGLFAPFAQGRGLSVSQIAELLAVFGLGGLLLQYPVGWLADHRGVGHAAICSALGSLLAAVLLIAPLNAALLVAGVFLLGGCITAFLTLAIIASTLTRSGSMAANVSRISMTYTASAVVRPLIAGATMKATQANALMWFTALAAIVMAGALAALASSRAGSHAPERPVMSADD
jgi:MFS family permease